MGLFASFLGPLVSWHRLGPDIPSDALGMPLAKDTGLGVCGRRLLFLAGKVLSWREGNPFSQDLPQEKQCPFQGRVSPPLCTGAQGWLLPTGCQRHPFAWRCDNQKCF